MLYSSIPWTPVEVRIKSDERLYHTLYGAGRQQLIEASESLIRDSLSRIKEGDSVKPRLWEARPHLRDVVDSIKVVECSESGIGPVGHSQHSNQTNPTLIRSFR